jgi:Putative lumazine-binding
MSAEDFAEVAAVAATYFDGLHFSDTVLLRQVFHPRAQYVCVTDGTLLYRNMAEYFPVVDARPSPSSRG